MRVLVACEESQAVCIEFRKRGHEAYSCDLQECSGGHPEWHIIEDVTRVLNGGYWDTQLGIRVYVESWDMMIGFPPCTDLAVSGAAWFEEKRRNGQQKKSISFFLSLTQSNIPKWAIENPVGIMSNEFRKPDQIINPFYFGDPVPKKTCLWLNGLPKLFHAKEKDLFNDQITHVEPKYVIGKRNGKKYSEIHYMSVGMAKGERGKLRSKTFPGIAKAMAEQWG